MTMKRICDRCGNEIADTIGIYHYNIEGGEPKDLCLKCTEEFNEHFMKNIVRVRPPEPKTETTLEMRTPTVMDDVTDVFIPKDEPPTEPSE